SDISRSITHLKANFKYDDFEKNIRKVLADKKVIEKELNSDNGLILLIRIFPFIRKGNAIDGALISFIDITGFKKLDNIVNGVFESSKSSIIALSELRNASGKISDLLITTCNNVANQLFGKKISGEQ